MPRMSDRKKKKKKTKVVVVKEAKEKETFTCNTCERSFAHKNSLIRHRNAVHADQQKKHALLVAEALEAEQRKRTPGRFTCEACKQTFALKLNWELHRAECRTKLPLPCAQCNRIFPDKRSLARHRSEKHAAALARLDCEFCGKRFRWPAKLDAHLRTHTLEKPHSCDECPKRFADKGSLAKHERTHRSERPHGCDSCGKAFSSATILREHQRIHSNEKPHVCEICLREFRHISNYTRHKRQVHQLRPQRCGLCPDVSFDTRQALNDHQRREHGPPVTEDDAAFLQHCCNLCQVAFESAEQLLSHCRSAHRDSDKGRAACPLCPKTFASDAARDRHQLAHVTSNGEHICGECGKRFARASELEYHAVAHAGRKPFGCDTCDKRFLRKSSLLAHQHLHEARPKFLCDVCGKSFPAPAVLEAHIRTHTDSRPYECLVCNATFRAKNHLKNHDRVHNRKKCFHCIACSRDFTDSQEYLDHLENHSPEDGVYMCRECLKTFNSEAKLRRHGKCHSEGWRHRCDFCEATFRDKGTFNYHQQTVHHDLLMETLQEPEEVTLPPSPVAPPAVTDMDSTRVEVKTEVKVEVKEEEDMDVPSSSVTVIFLRKSD